MSNAPKVPPIRISPTEQGKLRGLPFFVRCLYVLAIRPYMDISNGFVGLVSTVSYGSLAADMYVEPHQGEEDSGTPTVSRVKRAVKRLEKAGLIENRSIATITEKRLIFFCPCADVGQSVQKKAGPNSDHSPKKAGPQPEPQKLSIGAPYTPQTEPQPEPLFFEQVEKAGSHQEIGNTTELPNGSSNSCASPSRFAEFWEAYPVKKGKAEAEKKWKAKKLDTIADQILEDVKKRQSYDSRWRNGYIPYGSTYVSKEVWRDEIEAVSTENQRSNHEADQRPYHSAQSANEAAIRAGRERRQREEAESGVVIEGKWNRVRG